MKPLKILEYERWILEHQVGRFGYQIVGAQENRGYVQFTIRKQVCVPNEKHRKENTT